MVKCNDAAPENCSYCGRACGAGRREGEIGLCGAGARIRAAAYLLHFGEEPPISGGAGSGTIFFSGCPLSCCYCQNHQISQENQGRELSAAELAEWMLDLQSRGAANINLVSPTPYAGQIAAAAGIARDQGLFLPLVYNTGGFDSPAALAAVEGLIDVYLPDAKYDDPADAAGLSGAHQYPRVNRRALSIMHDQVGGLTFDERGLARRGLLVRHLVLPGRVHASRRILAWLAETFGADLWLSLMAQYQPRHFALKSADGDLARPLTVEEYEAVVDAAWGLGFENAFVQDPSAREVYLPDFNDPQVFRRID